MIITPEATISSLVFKKLLIFAPSHLVPSNSQNYPTLLIFWLKPCWVDKKLSVGAAGGQILSPRLFITQ